MRSTCFRYPGHCRPVRAHGVHPSGLASHCNSVKVKVCLSLMCRNDSRVFSSVDMRGRHGRAFRNWIARSQRAGTTTNWQANTSTVHKRRYLSRRNDHMQRWTRLTIPFCETPKKRVLERSVFEMRFFEFNTGPRPRNQFYRRCSSRLRYLMPTLQITKLKAQPRFNGEPQVGCSDSGARDDDAESEDTGKGMHHVLTMRSGFVSSNAIPGESAS